MALGEDIEGAEIVLILALIGGIGYGIYYVITNGLNTLLPNGVPGPGTSDPGGGAPATSTLGAIGNQVLEIGQSSLSWEDAIQQEGSNFVGVIGSIFGGSDDGSDN